MLANTCRLLRILLVNNHYQNPSADQSQSENRKPHRWIGTEETATSAMNSTLLNFHARFPNKNAKKCQIFNANQATLCSAKNYNGHK